MRGAYFRHFNAPTFHVHLAEVEVDPDTGQVTILRYVVAQDVGRAINPNGDRGPDPRRRRPGHRLRALREHPHRGRAHPRVRPRELPAAGRPRRPADRVDPARAPRPGRAARGQGRGRAADRAGRGRDRERRQRRRRAPVRPPADHPVRRARRHPWPRHRTGEGDDALTIVTFGEAMLRLTPPGLQRLEQANAFDLWVAGAELNVAVALARLGEPAAWISRLPDNPLGRRLAAHARANGVDTDGVPWTEDGRLGLLFVEVGSRRARPPAFTTAATRPSPPSTRPRSTGRRCSTAPAHCTRAASRRRCRRRASARPPTRCAAARAAGCHTSFDLNYRSRLTRPPARAPPRAPRAAPRHRDRLGRRGRAVFGLAGAPPTSRRAPRPLGVERVVISSRLDGPDGPQHGAARPRTASWSRSTPPSSPRSTRSAAATPSPPASSRAARRRSGRGLELAGAVAALKQSIPGDFAIIDADEVEHLAADGDARTRR